MPHRKMNRLLPIGLLMLAAGLILHNFLRAHYSEFAGGFLIGMALVFMIAGLVWRRRGTT
jgi:hypothetical protein